MMAVCYSSPAHYVAGWTLSLWLPRYTAPFFNVQLRSFPRRRAITGASLRWTSSSLHSHTNCSVSWSQPLPRG